MSDTVDTIILKLRTELDDKSVQKLDKQLYDLGLKIVSFGDKGEQALQRIDVSSKAVEKSFTDLALKIYATLKGMQKLFEEMEQRYKDQTAAVYEADGAYGKLTRSMNDIKEGFSAFIVEILSPFLEGFNKLPDQAKLVAIAIAAVGYTATEAGEKMKNAIIAFVKNPFGQIALAIGAVVGVIGLLSRKSTIDLNAVNANIDAFADSVDRLKKSSDAVKNTKVLLEQLDNARGNQQEYARIAGIILNSNENLKGSNLTVASSYNEIAIAANDAAHAMLSMDTVKAVEGFDKIEKDFKKMASELSNGWDMYSKDNSLAELTAIGFDPFGDSISKQYANRKNASYTISDKNLQELSIVQAKVITYMNKLGHMLAGARELDAATGFTEEKLYENMLMQYLDINFKIHDGDVLNPLHPQSLNESYTKWYQAKKDLIDNVERTATAETTRRENIRNPKTRVPTAVNAEVKDPSYDLEALRIKAMEDSYARQEELADKAYEEEKKRLADSADYKNATAAKKEEALYNLSITQMEAQAERRSKIDGESFEARKQFIDGINAKEQEALRAHYDEQIKLAQDVNQKNALSLEFTKELDALRAGQSKRSEEDVYAYRARLAEEAYERDIADIKARGLAEDVMNAAVARRERAHNKELQGIETERIEKGKEKQIKVINDIGEVLETAMSLATEPLDKYLDGDKKGAKKALGESLKGAVSTGLSAIPGIGGTLSSVFEGAVSLFGSLFKDRSKGGARVLSEALEKSVQKFDEAFKLSEVYKLLLNEYSEGALSEGVEEQNERRRDLLDDLNLNQDMTQDEFAAIAAAAKNPLAARDKSGTYGNIFKDYRSWWDKLWGKRGSGFSSLANNQRARKEYEENIRKYFQATYGEQADAYLRIYGLVKDDGSLDIYKWYDSAVRERDGGLSAWQKSVQSGVMETSKAFADSKDAYIKSIWGAASNELDALNARYEAGRITYADMLEEQSAIIDKAIEGLGDFSGFGDIEGIINEAYAKQLDINLAKGVEKTQKAVSKLNKEYELGEIALEEMVELGLREIDAAIAYLETLGETEQVQEAIKDLMLDRINLQKRLNDSELVASYGGAGLGDLLAKKTELDRDIAAGKKTGGTYETAAEQERILREIIANLKSQGAGRDDYFQFEEELARVIEQFGGASYHAATGQGYTPGVSDIGGAYVSPRETFSNLVYGDFSGYTLPPINPDVFYPQVPVTATAPYMQAAAAELAALRLGGPSVTNNEITNTTNTVHVNNKRLRVDDAFIDEFDAVLRRRTGEGIL